MTSLRPRTQSPAEEELKLGAKGGALYLALACAAPAGNGHDVGAAVEVERTTALQGLSLDQSLKLPSFTNQAPFHHFYTFATCHVRVAASRNDSPDKKNLGFPTALQIFRYEYWQKMRGYF